MWMPNESDNLAKVAGENRLVGKIISRIENPQVGSGGFFSGTQPVVSLFRLQDEQTGQVVSIRFEGPINALLDQGDRLHVQGYLTQGVLYARRIVDDGGAVLAQSKCFVATAVYGDPMAPEVETLRRFRSEVLDPNPFGRRLTALYWRVGPHLATWIERRPAFRWGCRWLVLQPVHGLVRALLQRRFSACRRTRIVHGRHACRTNEKWQTRGELVGGLAAADCASRSHYKQRSCAYKEKIMSEHAGESIGESQADRMEDLQQQERETDQQLQEQMETSDESYENAEQKWDDFTENDEALKNNQTESPSEFADAAEDVEQKKQEAYDAAGQAEQDMMETNHTKNELQELRDQMEALNEPHAGQSIGGKLDN